MEPPFFWVKKQSQAFTLSSMFFRHLLCLRTSSVVAYLYQLKCSVEYRKYYPCRITAFYRLKALQYLCLVTFMIRVFIPSTFTTKEEVIDHFPFNPVTCAAMLHFRFVASSTTLKAVCLFVIFVVHIDYSIHFNVDAFLVKIIYEMIVENGRHFKLLNRKRFHWPEVKLANCWQMYSLYRRLCREIWICLSLRFHRETLESFPNLSLKLRARMVVYSTIFEAFIFVCNVILSK